MFDEINLADLDGSNGFVINGTDNQGILGFSVSGAGDINGDGLDDIIFGAPSAGPYPQSSAYYFTNKGESYVVFGTTSGFDSNISVATLDGSNGFTINGIDVDDFSGTSVSNAGDVNGDGFDDIIVGAPNASTTSGYYRYGYYYPYTDRRGESYVVFGSTNGFESSLELSALDGNNGFVINGIAPGDNSGRSVSNAGDVNGDGINDLIISSFLADPNGNSSAGESYIVFGSTNEFDSSLDLSSLDGNNGFVINGINPGDYLGFSVSRAGDVNDDDIDDVIIGAYRAAPNENEFAGESYVVFGSTNRFDSSLDLLALDGNNGFVINGIAFEDTSGFSVSDAGDVNGDGIDDVIIGADGADPNGVNRAGESYIVFGSNSGFAPSLDLATLNGSNGFVINGIDSSDGSGFSVNGAGDVNGDNIDDVIIGADFADANGNFNAGESYVVFGSRSGFSSSLDLSSLDGSNGFIINGINERDRSGFSVSGAGDVNGDGFDDVIIGAPGTTSYAGVVYDVGDSYVIFGFPTQTKSINGTAGDDLLLGTPDSDTISGLAGNDTIYGEAGADTLFGDSGNDLISGGDGNDIVRAGAGNDIINGNGGADILGGGNGNDTIAGNAGRDRLSGGAGKDFMSGNRGDDGLYSGNGDDTLLGNAGADTLTGGNGNDNLNGGAGDDKLVGVALNLSSNLGTGETDTLTGGMGSDLFVLGNASGVFYNDGDSLTFGDADFALLKDFNLQQDRVQLAGAIEQYSLDFVSGNAGNLDARLIYDSGTTEGLELIALIKNVSATLDLSDSAFTFV